MREMRHKHDPGRGMEDGSDDGDGDGGRVPRLGTIRPAVEYREHYSYELPRGKYYSNVYDPLYLHRHGVPSLKNANNCISI